jgi:hypothetical protein
VEKKMSVFFRVAMSLVLSFAAVSGGVNSLMGLSAMASSQGSDEGFDEAGGCSDGTGATCGSCSCHWVAQDKNALELSQN